jgi:NADH-quinone oxidoreductase subunit H
LIVILFLGGWHFWGVTGSVGGEVTWLTAVLRVIVLMTKIFLVIFFFMMVRWSWPRFRFDQLMNLAWKVMLPLGMVNLTAVAVFLELRKGFDASNWILVPLAWLVCLAGWLAVAYTAPLASDNRPRRELHTHGIDVQI